MKRTIAVVSSSRADYSHLRWVLHELNEHPAVDLRLIACAALLSEEFGSAVDEIAADGFRVDERVECLLSADGDTGMARTIGLATLGFADVLGRMRPDLLLLVADRYEMLAPASVALALRVPIAHIEGGEISEGAIDDAVRNALTKMSHVHLTPTEQARRRVLALGEEPWRVHRVGAPSLDHLRRSPLATRADLERRLGHGIEPDAILVAHHPLTLADDTLEEADAVFAALARVDRQVLFCFPNADAGSRRLVERARRFCDSSARSRLWVNLDPVTYWSLLRCVGVLAGNSSSGIMEAGSIPLPTVNIGLRQQGRERAPHVIDAEARPETILAALERAASDEFRASLDGMENPYGDGRAAERIRDILIDIPLGRPLIVKKALPLRRSGPENSGIYTWAPDGGRTESN